MFENGLLSSFIPEILMVLAYMFCLIVPGLKTEKPTAELTPKVIQITTVQSTFVSVYKVRTKDFYFDNQVVDIEKKSSFIPKINKTIAFQEQTVYTSDSLNQVHFSRPPPLI